MSYCSSIVRDAGYEFAPRCYVGCGMYAPTQLGLGVISLLAYLDVGTVDLLCKIAVGLAAGSFIGFLVAGPLSNRRFEILTEALKFITFLIIGILGILNVLKEPMQLFWGINGTLLASLPVNYLFLYIKIRCQNRTEYERLS